MDRHEEQVKLPYTTPKLLVHGNMVSVVQNVGGDCADGVVGTPNDGWGTAGSNGICPVGS